MLKEIFEQPRTLRDAMSGRLIESEGLAHLGGTNLTPEDMKTIRRIVLTACGTSWHAALIGEYMIEEHARISAEVDYASELRYRNMVIDPETLCLVISQSGETADTLAAMREMQRKGAKALGICNVVGSTIARESNGGVYIHAGPEIGVASTKAFTSQVAALAIFTLFLARQRNLSMPQGQELVRALKDLPAQAESILASCDSIREIARHYASHNNFIYLGRGYNFPVALEGALKLKEISYIHAEGYPAAEMKHGPIALIDELMPVIFIAPKDGVHAKIVSNIEEVRARGGQVIAVVSDGDTIITPLVDHVISIPETMDMLSPVLTSVPLQLLAYFVAVRRGCNVDQPRNLAKSVTVE
jgi:glucosamine--fructose-6-phosphate aminotransferase (isomerizing)